MPETIELPRFLTQDGNLYIDVHDDPDLVELLQLLARSWKFAAPIAVALEAMSLNGMDAGRKRAEELLAKFDANTDKNELPIPAGDGTTVMVDSWTVCEWATRFERQA